MHNKTKLLGSGKIETAKSVTSPCVTEPTVPVGEAKLTPQRLVDAHGMLDAIFDDSCRPSIRWVREQTRNRAIPFVKFGGKVLFSVTEVQAFLDRKKAAAR